MKQSSIKILLICLFAIGPVLMSCEDQFLDEKPNSDLVVPTTLDDFQRLLDNYQDLNAKMPILGETSSDDYYLLTGSAWASLPTELRNAYVWKPDLYEGTENIADWNSAYRQVFVANVVLEGVENVPVTDANRRDRDRIKGWALFTRAYAFFNLAQLFAPIYDAGTASTDLGIPVRLEAGVDEPSVRASVRETYDQIIADLTESVELLPALLPTPNRNRASKPAATALLARVYLNMRNYELAQVWAESTLQLYNTLIDYNTLSLTSSGPFTRSNDETLYQAHFSDGVTLFYYYTLSPNTIVDSALYKTYAGSDLRKQIFFSVQNGLPKRKAAYSGIVSPFGGIATDEIYLIQAECLARSGAVHDAMDVLNRLWVNRADRNQPFIPLRAETPEEALALVLQERRKELAFRGLRWQDLRRLNKEGRNIVLRRKIGNDEYTLLPNSPLYVLPIPPDEIRLSGLEQNPR